MMETWMDVEGFEGHYQISSLGRLRAMARAINNGRYGRGTLKERILKLNERGGYHLASLALNGKHKTVSVHRLTAAAFIPNPDNKPQVNHINGDRKDNRVENLEWATCSENVLHSYRVLNRAPFPKGKFGDESPRSKQYKKKQNA